MSPQPVVVIACKVFQNFIDAYLPDGLAGEITFLDYGLHAIPKKLTQAVQETLDSIEEASLVVLGYGLCGNGLDGIKAGKHTLLIPRTDDCIAILLGSYQTYRQQFRDNPATYYLTKGWLESGSNPLDERNAYETKYGPDTADWLMDEQYKHYKRLVLVAHNQADLDKYRPKALEVARYCERWGMKYSVKEVSFLAHGTTVVINALIEGKGAKTALITTQGFRDILEIGRSNRLEMYDALYKKPDPLVPRHLRFGVKERLSAAGEVLVLLDAEDLDRIIEEMKRHQVEAVAVCLLNAYSNPEHEEKIGKLLQERYPEVTYSLSHLITRRYYEYERTSTTVQNAFVMPVVGNYLHSLEEELTSRNYKNVLQIMQSNGGVMTSTVARNMPIAMVESGPAAGAIGASQDWQD